VKIGAHDYETKLRHAEEFVEKGNKLKIVLQFRGRENAHKDLGMVMMQKIIKDLETMAHVDMPPKLVGRAIGMTLSPLPRKAQTPLREDRGRNTSRMTTTTTRRNDSEESDSPEATLEEEAAK